VPTPQDYNNDGVIDGTDNDQYQQTTFLKEFLSHSVMHRMVLVKELKELTWALGAEYTYSKCVYVKDRFILMKVIKRLKKNFSPLGAGFRFKIGPGGLVLFILFFKGEKPSGEYVGDFPLHLILGEEFLND